MSEPTTNEMVTVDQATFQKIQEEVGQTLAAVRKIEVTADKLGSFERRLASVEARGDMNKVHLDGTPHRAAWGHPTRQNARTGDREYGFSVHDVLKQLSGLKGEGWSRARTAEAWESFRDQPVQWREAEIARALKGEAGSMADAMLNLRTQAPTPNQRAANMSAGINTQGGYWVGEQWMPDIIPALTAQQVVMQAGAQEFNVGAGTGQVHWGREDARPTAYWVNEGVAPTSSGITSGDVVATPKFAAVLIKVTGQLLRMSTPSVEAYLRAAIGRELGLLGDLAFFRGTGGDGQPLGLTTMTNVGSQAVGANGGAITYALLRQLEDEVVEESPRMDRPAWVMHSNLMSRIARLTDDQSRPLLVSPDYAPGLAGPLPRTLFGYPVHISNQLPVNLTKGSGTGLTQCFFGDFSYARRVMWEGLEIRASDQAYDGTDSAFTQNMRFFLGLFAMDWLVEQPATFGQIPDATA